MKSRELMRRIALRWKRGRLTKSLQLWLTHNRQVQRLKQKEKEKAITLARAVSKMKNRILNASLISWVEKIQRKKKYQRYALKLYNRKKQSIFWTWTCYVQEEMHRRTLMARVVARLSKLKLFHSMQRWKNNVR